MSGWLDGWMMAGSTPPEIVTSGGNDIVKIVNNASITRTISNPVYESVLYFKYDVDALEADDMVVAEIYDWLSEQWVTVWSGYYYNNGSDSIGGGADIPDNLQEQFVDLSDAIVNVGQLRFRVNADSSDDVLFIDDITLFPKSYGFSSVQIPYADDMTTLTNGWIEESASADESGDTTGGIRVVDYGNGPFIQMNSWWDGASWTRLRKPIGYTIAINKDYTLKVRIDSFSSNKAVNLKLQNVFESWMDIAANSISLSTDGFNEYTVSFSTANGQNSWAVGDELGITIEAGWWNNMGVNRILLEESHVYYPGDLNRSGGVDIIDFGILSQGWQINYDMDDLIIYVQNWLDVQ